MIPCGQYNNCATKEKPESFRHPGLRSKRTYCHTIHDAARQSRSLADRARKEATRLVRGQASWLARWKMGDGRPIPSPIEQMLSGPFPLLLGGVYEIQGKFEAILDSIKTKSKI